MVRRWIFTYQNYFFSTVGHLDKQALETIKSKVKAKKSFLGNFLGQSSTFALPGSTIRPLDAPLLYFILKEKRKLDKERRLEPVIHKKTWILADHFSQEKCTDKHESFKSFRKTVFFSSWADFESENRPNTTGQVIKNVDLDRGPGP